MEVIPFKNIAGIMLVPARADGVEGWFAFDTGAMQTTLNKKYFPELEGKSAEVVIFDKSLSDAAVTEIKLKEFTVGSCLTKDLPVILMDMTYVEKSLREVSPDVCFYGSISPEALKKASVLLDYKRSEITVDPEVSVDGAEKIPLCSQALPVIMLEIAGEPYRFVLDTGANTCLLSAELSDKISACPLQDSPGVYVIPEIKAGTHEYRNVNAVFTDISQISNKFEADGVIGYQILSEQLSLIDFSNNELYLF